eukprot:CAMPEP_0204378512 /NCGR_PEP_ID=MMETSP0469-20131031/51839_1 /ASSEMBLY_ACC=CAM_ASM_000384 /TAXON_ID=2969 /ORGANISM="Oxyrrhis marina" /LENGTH=68 /DNA_ID=CAMNT_0051369805 /DNA_START=36 /DNA_END=239 /DNA_ORIENTATION=-
MTLLSWRRNDLATRDLGVVCQSCLASCGASEVTAAQLRLHLHLPTMHQGCAGVRLSEHTGGLKQHAGD